MPSAKVKIPSGRVVKQSAVPILNAENTCRDGKDLPAFLSGKKSSSKTLQGLGISKTCRITLTAAKGIPVLKISLIGVINDASRTPVKTRANAKANATRITHERSIIPSVFLTRPEP
jgi:hypothetical protein